MSKVTSKRQVTLPKAIADRYGIQPGDEIEWEVAGEVIRLYPHGRSQGSGGGDRWRLRLFDEATRRQERRNKAYPTRGGDRGWKREDFYERGLAD